MGNSTLTKSKVVYTIKNNFINKTLSIKNHLPVLANLPKESSTENFQFRILKLYSEEENIKQYNYDMVEKEPIDLFMKYIDLSDKNLIREGIKQTYKDYDVEELK